MGVPWRNEEDEKMDGECLKGNVIRLDESLFEGEARVREPPVDLPPRAFWIQEGGV